MLLIHTRIVVAKNFPIKPATLLLFNWDLQPQEIITGEIKKRVSGGLSLSAS